MPRSKLISRNLRYSRAWLKGSNQPSSRFWRFRLDTHTGHRTWHYPTPTFQPAYGFGE